MRVLTIEEYITKMKRADKLDEFDYIKIPENMSSVMKYVMSYFNEYLTMESCDAEKIKLQRATDKLEEEAATRFPRSKEFVVEFYLSTRLRIDKLVDNWLKKVRYLDLFYSEDDFSTLAADYCSSKTAGVDMQHRLDQIKTLMAELKDFNTYELDFADMIRLDRGLVAWIKDTYRDYGVNLITFSSNVSEAYYHRYVKYERREHGDGGYYINNYNHRYNDNPFDIDEIYRDNKHRPFLENKRGELEMLVMYDWLFNEVSDEEYWPEYVNLCIEKNRVNIVRSINPLISVAPAGYKYPEDVPCKVELITSSDGEMKKPPQGEYVLRLELTDERSSLWQDTEKFGSLIALLDQNFNEYGTPTLLELSAPFKTAAFDEESFFSCCSLLEKKMKKHSPMKIAIINGPTNQRKKPPSYLGTVDEIAEFKAKLRLRKIRIALSIDFTVLIPGKRGSGYHYRDIFGALAEMKNSIVSISLDYTPPQPSNGPKIKSLSGDTDVYYLSKFRYSIYDDIYSLLSAAFSDNQQRFLIPKGIRNDLELENLVDNLLRSGFALSGGGNHNG